MKIVPLRGPRPLETETLIFASQINIKRLQLNLIFADSKNQNFQLSLQFQNQQI